MDAIVLIVAGNRASGSGFFIGPEILVTAAHVIKGHHRVSLRTKAGAPIRGSAEVMKSGKFAQTGRARDDWAILKLVKGEPSDAWFEVGEAELHDRWTSRGFAIENGGAPLVLSGEVTGVGRQLQLFCQEASDPTFRPAGASGGPIVCDSLAVGLICGGLRGQPQATKGGVVFATSLAFLDDDDNDDDLSTFVRRSDSKLAVCFGVPDASEFEVYDDDDDDEYQGDEDDEYQGDEDDEHQDDEDDEYQDDEDDEYQDDEDDEYQDDEDDEYQNDEDDEYQDEDWG